MKSALMLGIASLFVCSISARAVEPALQSAVSAPSRTPALVARDSARHPAEELAFFGVKPTATVVEIWPGGGYWTEILAPYLHQHGTYYLAMGGEDGDGTEKHFGPSPKFQSLLSGHPEVYDKLKFTTFGAHHPDLAPPGSADLILTFRNLHNWLKAGNAPEMIADIYKALKPGGVLGIEDHRANTRTPQDPKAANGYVRQDYAISLIEHAGFKLVGSSEMNANPRDTADYPAGVWTLPPTFALKDKDHAKYAAIGEADNFVLKFVKN